MNIRVNAVVPGWIMTQRQVDLWLTPEGEAELMQRQCLKRKLMPAEIARVVLFFAADDSGACTNQSYIADGGWVQAGCSGPPCLATSPLVCGHCPTQHHNSF